MKLLSKLRQEWKELSGWAKKSWTIHFNTIAGLVGIFAENVAQLASVVKEDIYAILVVVVPSVNYLLRIKTQKQAKKKPRDEVDYENLG